MALSQSQANVLAHHVIYDTINTFKGGVQEGVQGGDQGVIGDCTAEFRGGVGGRYGGNQGDAGNRGGRGGWGDTFDMGVNTGSPGNLTLRDEISDLILENE